MQVTDTKVPTADAPRQPDWLDVKMAAKLITAAGVPCTVDDVYALVRGHHLKGRFGGAGLQIRPKSVRRYLKRLQRRRPRSAA